MAKAQPFRFRLAKAILGSKAKDFIPPLLPTDDLSFGGSGRLNDYTDKRSQLTANLGWCFAANNAIVDPTSAVELKLYRIKKDGDREEVKEHEILDLLDAPNLAHTGEQLRHLHFTYMNYVGESYIYMRGYDGGDFQPAKGKLPAAMEIFPAHLVDFKLGSSYTTSSVKYANQTLSVHPATTLIRVTEKKPKDSRLRVHELARQLGKRGLKNSDLLDQLAKWGEVVPSASAHLEDDQVTRLREHFSEQPYVLEPDTFTIRNEIVDDLKQLMKTEDGATPAVTPRERSAETRRRQTLDALLNAAEDLVRREGPNVKAESITALSGVSLATFYATFDSRDKLLDALLYRALDRTYELFALPMKESELNAVTRCLS